MGNSTARERFQQLAAERWAAVRASAPNAPWRGRHPAAELLEELADAMNYTLVWKSGDRQVSRDLLLAVESLGITVLTLLEQMQERGVDMTQWSFPSHRVQGESSPSSASFTPPISSEGNSPRRDTR